MLEVLPISLTKPVSDYRISDFIFSSSTNLGSFAAQISKLRTQNMRRRYCGGKAHRSYAPKEGRRRLRMERVFRLRL